MSRAKSERIFDLGANLRALRAFLGNPGNNSAQFILTGVEFEFLNQLLATASSREEEE